jgi:hypothetical protein
MFVTYLPYLITSYGVLLYFVIKLMTILLCLTFYDIPVSSLIYVKMSQICGLCGATWTSFTINSYMLLIKI